MAFSSSGKQEQVHHSEIVTGKSSPVAAQIQTRWHTRRRGRTLWMGMIGLIGCTTHQRRTHRRQSTLQEKP